MWALLPLLVGWVAVAAGPRSLVNTYPSQSSLTMCDGARQVAEARKDAAQARSAEARLRTMVRHANENAERLAAQRDQAQLQVGDLNEELDALKTLHQQEVECLQNRLDELEESLGEAQKPQPSEVELMNKVESLRAELHDARRRILSLEDEREEVKAELVLLRDEHALDMETLELALSERSNERRAPSIDSPTSCSSRDDRISELEKYVGELLSVIDGQQAGLLELAQLRPKATKADEYALILQEAGLLSDASGDESSVSSVEDFMSF